MILKTLRHLKNYKNTNAASHIGSSSNTTIATFTTTGSTGTEIMIHL